MPVPVPYDETLCRRKPEPRRCGHLLGSIDPEVNTDMWGLIIPHGGARNPVTRFEVFGRKCLDDYPEIGRRCESSMDG